MLNIAHVRGATVQQQASPYMYSPDASGSSSLLHHQMCLTGRRSTALLQGMATTPPAPGYYRSTDPAPGYGTSTNGSSAYATPAYSTPAHSTTTSFSSAKGAPSPVHAGDPNYVHDPRTAGPHTAQTADDDDDYEDDHDDGDSVATGEDPNHHRRRRKAKEALHKAGAQDQEGV